MNAAGFVFFESIIILSVIAAVVWDHYHPASPLTDDEKRAFGKHLPPHLRSDPSKW